MRVQLGGNGSHFYVRLSPMDRILSILKRSERWDQWHDLLQYCAQGTHVENPYHNLEHELTVAYHASAAFTLIGEQSIYSNEWNMLIAAAVLHDHNHSGGVLQDKQNIMRVRDALDTRTLQALLESLNIDPFTGAACSQAKVRKLIETTEYDAVNKHFPVVPQSLAAQCLRDADLCSIYTEEGRELLLGLGAEIYKQPSFNHLDETQCTQFYKGNVIFLHTAKMFTDYGQTLKSEQLSRALSHLKQRVIGSADVDSIESILEQAKTSELTTSQMKMSPTSK